MTLRRATERLREVGSLPVLLSALLIAAGGDLSAQDRSRANDSSDRGGSRVAQPRDSGGSHRSSPPSSPPSSSSPSSPPRSASPPSGGSDSPSTSSSPSRPRYAQPGSPSSGARRQPPSRDRNDPDWRGGRGHGGDWYGHGGYYYPRWYRYYGPGWWWAPYGYWGWWWLGDNYWPYDPYYGYPPYDRGRGYSGRDEVGALDLDVSPGRTQVYLDGQYLGTVDQYDGFPTFLWLEKGTYDIAFYLEGYKTLARQVTVYPGTVIDMEDRLEPGQSVRPEDLVTKSHERRDDRLRYERDRRERIERGDRDGRDEDEDEEDEDWRDRVSRNREDRRDRGEEIEIEDEDAEELGRSEQGRVRLEVEPEDASIYLDGQFVGTAEDLSNLRRGLLVVPGKHNVAVVRPGRESVEREFEVEAGEELELEIELEPASR